MGVAGGEDAEGHVEVDVLVAIRVPDPRPARIGHEQRVRVVGLERARHAERQRAARAFEQLRALRCPFSICCFLARADLGDPRAADLDAR
jgi:hypothetical protein